MYYVIYLYIYIYTKPKSNIYIFQLYILVVKFKNKSRQFKCEGDLKSEFWKIYKYLLLVAKKIGKSHSFICCFNTRYKKIL